MAAHALITFLNNKAFILSLLSVYTDRTLSRDEMTLHEMQVFLNREGASDLVADLVMKSCLSPSVFMEAVQLGIALLEGGNPVIQRSLFKKLQTAETSAVFLKVFHDTMRESQNEIRSSMSVNTTEIAYRGHVDNQDNIQDPENLPTSLHSTEDETKMLSGKVLVMLPVLRFLQLLCENHNSDLQNFLRAQSNKGGYNLVSETLMFLDCICGSTTGELGLLGLYINERNVPLINQTLETLTEYCQGPCRENQNCIATHESNGLDIITALLLTEINPLVQHRMDLVLELKNKASKLLLAVVESREDSENSERILYNMKPHQLVDVACQSYHQKTIHEEEPTSPKEVGHNIYILCHQLSQHNKALAALMKPTEKSGAKTNEALEYYSNHTAQIEIVRHDRTMEHIVFPIPEMCEYLTADTKECVFNTMERDDQGSKVAAFFEKSDVMFEEMMWQKKLRGQWLLFWVSRHMSVWSNVLFNLIVIINLVVALFYPFDQQNQPPNLGTHVSGLIWVVMLLSTAVAFVLPKPATILTLVMTLVVQFICSVGPQPTLTLLGTSAVLIKGVHILSIAGNKGTFQRSVHQICTDTEMIYNVVYLMFCLMGLVTHPFFFSVLVVF